MSRASCRGLRTHSSSGITGRHEGYGPWKRDFTRFDVETIRSRNLHACGCSQHARHRCGRRQPLCSASRRSTRPSFALGMHWAVRMPVNLRYDLRLRLNRTLAVRLDAAWPQVDRMNELAIKPSWWHRRAGVMRSAARTGADPEPYPQYTHEHAKPVPFARSRRRRYEVRRGWLLGHDQRPASKSRHHLLQCICRLL